MSHIPVLHESVLNALLPDGEPVGTVIDGTLGAGGHTRFLLDHGVEKVLGLDLDQQAIDLAGQNLAEYADRVHIVRDSYVNMMHHVVLLGVEQVDSILLDLGVSSMQLDTPERGFAFSHDGPLDMRFTRQDNRITAADIVNTWSDSDLADIFFRYGEERHARRFARMIVRQRPFATTRDLAEAIVAATPAAARQRIHPATRVFQALRIAVNDELRMIETALPIAIDLLKPGGRLAVISFHSLEDRIVKQTFKHASTSVVAPPGMASLEERDAVVELMTRKPITATAQEIAQNPRSRSAKLRVVVKL